MIYHPSSTLVRPGYHTKFFCFAFRTRGIKDGAATLVIPEGLVPVQEEGNRIRGVARVVSSQRVFFRVAL